MNRRTRIAALAVVATVAACGLAGLFIGAAIQVNHPHHQPGWDAPFWLSGLLLGLAAGLVFGLFAGGAAWDLSE